MIETISTWDLIPKGKVKIKIISIPTQTNLGPHFLKLTYEVGREVLEFISAHEAKSLLRRSGFEI